MYAETYEIVDFMLIYVFIIVVITNVLFNFHIIINSVIFAEITIVSMPSYLTSFF